MLRSGLFPAGRITTGLQILDLFRRALPPQRLVAIGETAEPLDHLTVFDGVVQRAFAFKAVPGKVDTQVLEVDMLARYVARALAYKA